MFAVLAPALAEEVVLKDGSKIVGRMVAVKGDKIEMETPYGKMQIRRSDILAINFPENEGTAVSRSSSGPTKAKPVDEALTGTQYVNRTGRFTLTVPIEWKINSEVRANTDSLAALSSRDDMRFVIVEHEPFSGSLESYKGLFEVQTRRNLSSYEKLSESNVSIDGRPGVLLTFRGINPQAQNLPIQFVAAIAAFDGEYLHAVAWCVEPIFNESQRTLESILLSYRRISGGATANPPGSLLSPQGRNAPTSLHGQPVEVDTTIDVIFSLEEKRSPSVSSTANALVFADFPAPAGNGPKGLSLVLRV